MAEETLAPPPVATPKTLLQRLRDLVVGVHQRVHVVRTVHALPFAAVGSLAARQSGPSLREVVLVVLAVIFGRGLLVSMNRWFGAPEDVANPEVDLGVPREATPRAVWMAFALHAAAVLIFVAWMLNPLAGELSVVAVVLLVLAAAVRARTGISHALLGLGLALAPLGAWVALRGTLDLDALGIGVFAAGVILWATGFDMIFSLQPRLRRLGAPGSFIKPPAIPVMSVRKVARVLHIVAAGVFVVAGPIQGFGPLWYLGIAGTIGILVLAHRAQRAPDGADAGRAFLAWNLLVGPGLLAAAVLGTVG